MNALDRRLLANLNADSAEWVLIGRHKIAIVQRIELGPNDVWANEWYWAVGYLNRDGNGGGGAGYDTEPEAVRFAEQMTGVDAVAQGVLHLETVLNA